MRWTFVDSKEFLTSLFFMIVFGLLGAMLIVMSCKVAVGEEVYRDRSGKIVLKSSESKGKTTFRDASGKVVGSATQSGKTTTYRDSSGKTIATTNSRSSKPSPTPILKGKK